MARKDTMKGLLGDDTSPSDPPARVDAAKPRYSKGAIGAVSRSIEDLKRRSIVEVDARMIDAAGLRDRLDAEDSDHDALVSSIRDHGQQVPVLLRVSPNDSERYQVVYGRRRVAALKELSVPVKALIRDLDDQALIMAQGQENSARKDLTFIEKANFARQMRDAGYDRKAMGDALSMDKTLISRLLSVADKVSVDLIEAIGSAPSIGRDRWLALADKVGGRDLRSEVVGDTSDARFESIMSALQNPRKEAPKPEMITDGQGAALAEISRNGGSTTLRIQQKTSAGFDQWLIDNLPDIHRNWKQGGGE